MTSILVGSDSASALLRARSGLRRLTWSAFTPAILVLLVYGVWLLAMLNSGRDARDFIHMGRRYVFAPHAVSLFKPDPKYQYSTTSDGYDGQFAFYIAVAPVNARLHLDRVNYRYTRIVYPMTARLLSFGHADLIPYALILINWFAIAAGTYVVALWLRRRGIAPWLALVYGLSPGLFVCLQRDLEEPLAYALVALAVFVYSSGESLISAPDANTRAQGAVADGRDIDVHERVGGTAHGPFPTMRLAGVVRCAALGRFGRGAESRDSEAHGRTGGQARGPAPTNSSQPDRRRDRPVWRSALVFRGSTGGPARGPASTTASHRHGIETGENDTTDRKSGTAHHPFPTGRLVNVAQWTTRWRARRSGQEPSGERRRAVWSGIIFALAILTRESMAIFPLVLALVAFFTRDSSAVPAARRQRLRGVAFMLVPALLPFLLYKAFLLYWLSSNTDAFPSALLPRLVPFSGLISYYPWRNHQVEVIIGVVAPSLVCAGMGGWAVWKRRASPEVWLLLANVLIFVVMLNKLSYENIYATGRIATGVMLAALLCIPTFDRLTGRDRLWLSFTALLWFLPWPILVPFVEEVPLTRALLLELVLALVLWALAEGGLRAVNAITVQRRRAP